MERLQARVGERDPPRPLAEHRGRGPVLERGQTRAEVPHRPPARQAPVPPRAPADEVDAAADGEGLAAVGTQHERQPLADERRDLHAPGAERLRVVREQHQVVHVAR
jgi:hypothetical protein